MAFSIYTHASVGDVRRPRPLAVCDRCGFVYNRDKLRLQYDWAGLKEMNRGVLVCNTCMDTPQTQLKVFHIPIDPVPIRNPRPGEYSGMAISSSPNVFDTVVPSQIVVESLIETDFQSNAFQQNAFQVGIPVAATEIGDRPPMVTETSSLPLLTEVTVTPYPDPNIGDGGYTRMSS